MGENQLILSEVTLEFQTEVTSYLPLLQDTRNESWSNGNTTEGNFTGFQLLVINNTPIAIIIKQKRICFLMIMSVPS